MQNQGSDDAMWAAEYAEANGLQVVTPITDDNLAIASPSELRAKDMRRALQVPTPVWSWPFGKAREWLRRARRLPETTRETCYPIAARIMYAASCNQRLALYADAQCSPSAGTCGILHLAPLGDTRRRLELAESEAFSEVIAFRSSAPLPNGARGLPGDASLFATHFE